MGVGYVLNIPKPFFNNHHYAAHDRKTSTVLLAEIPVCQRGTSRKGTA
jgi:hypothetical protein